MVHAGKAVLALVVSAVLPMSVLAHERGDRARGVVERLDSAAIAVETSDGHTVTFAVTPETRFTRGDVAAKPGEVEVGERVVVEGRRAGERLEAIRVKLGASSKKPASH